MNEVRMNKNDLIKIITENKEKHESEYKEAMLGYFAEAEKELKKQLKKVKAQTDDNIYIHLNRPENKSDEYQLVINKLNHTLDEEITLTDFDYSRFVEDNWEWTHNLKAINSTYLGKV